MTDRDYVHAMQLCYDVLYSKARCARGRPDIDKNCRRRCGVKQTLNHVIQQCHHTYFGHIKRHNALVDYVQRVDQDRGMTVHKEPQFKVGDRKLIPDIVIYSQDRVVLVDAQVINEQFPLKSAYVNKINKYLALGDQLAGLRPGGFQCSALTMNWRGVVAGSSGKELIALNILKKQDLKIFAARSLIGSTFIHRAQQRMTNSGRTVKTGVG